MKKLINGFMAFTVLAMIIGTIVWADGDDDNKTDSDAGAFHSSYGAQVRLLQLEVSVKKNILEGNAIVSYLKQKNNSIDTSDLEAILAQMDTLAGDISAVQPASGNDSAQVFVDLKDDARNLSNEFHDSVHGILNESDAKALRKQLETIKWNQTKDLVQKINETRHEYNADVVERILARANITDSDLLEKVRNGTANQTDIKDALKDAFSMLNESQKNHAYVAIKEETAKSKVFMRAIADKIVYQQGEREANRTETRIDKAEKMNLSQAVIDQLEKHKEQSLERIGRIQNRTDQRIERIGNITDRRIDRLENMSGRMGNRSVNATNNLEDILSSGNLTDAERAKIEERIGRIGNRTESGQDMINQSEERVRQRGDRLTGYMNKTIGGGKK